MPAFREVVPEEDGEDRFVVPTDLLHRWLSSPEPRIPWSEYIEMFRGTDEYPTSPECPIAIHDSDPPTSRP